MIRAPAAQTVYVRETGPAPEPSSADFSGSDTALFDLLLGGGLGAGNGLMGTLFLEGIYWGKDSLGFGLQLSDFGVASGLLFSGSSLDGQAGKILVVGRTAPMTSFVYGIGLGAYQGTLTTTCGLFSFEDECTRERSSRSGVAASAFVGGVFRARGFTAEVRLSASVLSDDGAAVTAELGLGGSLLSV
jgi:hypothetical protein